MADEAVCAECGQVIATTETRFEHEGRTVCEKCFGILQECEAEGPPDGAARGPVTGGADVGGGALRIPSYPALHVAGHVMWYAGWVMVAAGVLGVLVMFLIVQDRSSGGGADMSALAVCLWPIGLACCGLSTVVWGEVVLALRDMAINSFYARRDVTAW